MFGGFSLKFLIEDVKNAVEKAKKDYIEGLKKEDELYELLNELIKLKNYITTQIEEIRAMIQYTRPSKIKELTAHEYLTIAIAQRPKAPETIKKEAEKIIEKYGLTPEEVERIHESIFG